MLVIRFKKIGRKNQKTFRLILTEKRSAARGKPLEYLGWWNPYLKKGEFKEERIKYWVGQGAKILDTAKSILARNGITW